MPFKILRTNSGWIMNDGGDVMVKDTDKGTIVWVPHNMISFDNQNRPQFRNTNEPLEYSNIDTHPIVDEHDSHTTELPVNVHDTTEFNLSENQQSNNSTFYEDEDSERQMEGSNLKNIWGHQQTLSLIAAVEQHYDNMYHIHKRKTFWNVISEQLNAQNIMFSEQACKKKWLNLLRTYKSTKDNKNKTGRGPTRFPHFERLDDLLGNNPTNSSPHSIDISVPSQSSADKENIESTDTDTVAKSSNSSKNSENIKKRKNPTMDLIKVKKAYYEKKSEQMETKEEARNEYVRECLRIKTERLELLKKKIELEERKVVALEQLLNKEANDNSNV